MPSLWAWSILCIPLASWQTPGAQGPQLPVASGEPVDATIELERTMCFGTCPSFKVALDADGTVRWKGGSYVGALERTTHVPPFEVRYLFDRFLAIDFATLEPRYGVTDDDGPTMILRMRSGDLRKAVELNSTVGRIDGDGREIEGWQAEEELIALGGAMESVLHLERWILTKDPIEPRTSDYTSEAFGLSTEEIGAARIELTSESDERGSTSYRIVLRGDGRVEWEGRAHVREIGARTSAIPVEQVRWLLHRFEEAKFFERSNPESDFETSITLRLPGREHGVGFRMPKRPTLTWYPDSIHRTAIDCDALARTIRVLVRADRWIGWGWERMAGHEGKPR